MTKAVTPDFPWRLPMDRHSHIRPLWLCGFCRGVALLTVLSCLATAAFAQPDSLWSRIYGADLHAWGTRVLQTSDGGFLMAGIADEFQGGSALWVAKANANGDSLWSGYYDGGATAFTYGLCPAPDNGSLLVASG